MEFLSEIINFLIHTQNWILLLISIGITTLLLYLISRTLFGTTAAGVRRSTFRKYLRRTVILFQLFAFVIFTITVVAMILIKVQFFYQSSIPKALSEYWNVLVFMSLFLAVIVTTVNVLIDTWRVKRGLAELRWISILD